MFVQGDDCDGIAALEAWGEARSVYPLGDFYREDDDVMRGITISTPDVPEPLESFNRPEVLAPRDCMKPFKGSLSEVEQRDGDAALVFHESDVLPKFPESHLVEAKTVYLSTEVPCWKLGNRLLSFLREKAVSHIKKVNKKKYTVKAQVLCNGLVCEIKIRAYRSAKEIAVVVHRLGGDSIAFNALFRLLKQDLTIGLPLELKAEADVSPTEMPSDEVHETEPLGPAVSSHVAPSENAFLEPIIDAAHNADDTQAQAEAAASLAAAAEDTGTVTQLCNQKAQRAVEKLLKVDCFEVSCQVVRLIMKLAVAPGAEAFFNGEGLLHLLQRKVSDLAAGKKLRVQLSWTVDKLHKLRRTQVRHAAHH